MNRTQALVLGFLGVAWIALVVLLVLAPEVYDAQLARMGAGGTLARLAFLGGVTAVVAIAALGTVRRWRWAFWLLLVASLAGVLRLPAAVLQLGGLMPADGPPWYVAMQGAIGLVQLALGLTMLAGYRRGGPWAA